MGRAGREDHVVNQTVSFMIMLRHEERLGQAGYEKSMVGDVQPLLSSADHVKFASERPTSHRAHEWLGTARSWIEQTLVEPVYTTPESVAAAQELTEGRRTR